MAYIESHQEMERHPKTDGLAEDMGWSKFDAIGRLHVLWWWCVDYAEDGDLRKYGSAIIARVMGVDSKDSEKLKAAMIKNGWIDEVPYLRLHDWWEYVGAFLRAKYRQNPQKWMVVRNSYSDSHAELFEVETGMKMSEWSRQVRERDDNTCQQCGTKEGSMHAHHIKPQAKYPALIFKIENGICLCRKCHKETHGKEEILESTFLRKVSENYQKRLPTKPNQTKENQTKSVDGAKVSREDLEYPVLYLNEKLGTKFGVDAAPTVRLIKARYAEGRKKADFTLVIDKKVAEWRTNEKMSQYLRPSTLFNATNFENYLNQPWTGARNVQAEDEGRGAVPFVVRQAREARKQKGVK